MKKLDSEWGRGPRYKEAELKSIDFIKTQPLWEKMTCVVAANHSRTDGLWTLNNCLKFLTEVKSRDSFGKNSSLEFTWNNLLSKYKGEYMISKSKIDENVSVAKFFGVPFYLIVNFMLENKLLFIPVSDSEGNMVVKHREEERTTQSTSNGGVKRDLIYQLDVSATPSNRWMDMSQIK
jgi:hypothetical protein